MSSPARTRQLARSSSDEALANAIQLLHAEQTAAPEVIVVVIVAHLVAEGPSLPPDPFGVDVWRRYLLYDGRRLEAANAAAASQVHAEAVTHFLNCANALGVAIGRTRVRRRPRSKGPPRAGRHRSRKPASAPCGHSSSVRIPRKRASAARPIAGGRPPRRSLHCNPFAPSPLPGVGRSTFAARPGRRRVREGTSRLAPTASGSVPASKRSLTLRCS